MGFASGFTRGFLKGQIGAQEDQKKLEMEKDKTYAELVTRLAMEQAGQYPKLVQEAKQKQNTYHYVKTTYGHAAADYFLNTGDLNPDALRQIKGSSNYVGGNPDFTSQITGLRDGLRGSLRNAMGDKWRDDLFDQMFPVPNIGQPSGGPELPQGGVTFLGEGSNFAPLQNKLHESIGMLLSGGKDVIFSQDGQFKGLSSDMNYSLSSISAWASKKALQEAQVMMSSGQIADMREFPIQPVAKMAFDTWQRAYTSLVQSGLDPTAAHMRIFNMTDEQLDAIAQGGDTIAVTSPDSAGAPTGAWTQVVSQEEAALVKKAFDAYNRGEDMPTDQKIRVQQITKKLRSSGHWEEFQTSYLMGQPAGEAEQAPEAGGESILPESPTKDDEGALPPIEYKQPLSTSIGEAMTQEGNDRAWEMTGELYGGLWDDLSSILSEAEIQHEFKDEAGKKVLYVNGQRIDPAWPIPQITRFLEDLISATTSAAETVKEKAPGLLQRALPMPGAGVGGFE